jgi:catechol 2,3-dioxygenase-like lactoylglutathione lyase family enzyme
MVPFSLRQIDHIVLRVRDVDRSLAFYLDALGCRMEKRQEGIGLIQIRAGSSLIDLVPIDGPLGRIGGAPPSKEGRNVDHFALQIAPFDEPAIRRHLAEHDVPIRDSGQRYGAEGTGPSFYIEDPDGNTVELKGPPTA